MNGLTNLFQSHMLIFLNVINPTNLTNLSDLTSKFRETSVKIVEPKSHVISKVRSRSRSNILNKCHIDLLEF